MRCYKFISLFACSESHKCSFGLFLTFYKFINVCNSYKFFYFKLLFSYLETWTTLSLAPKFSDSPVVQKQLVSLLLAVWLLPTQTVNKFEYEGKDESFLSSVFLCDSFLAFYSTFLANSKWYWMCIFWYTRWSWKMMRFFLVGVMPHMLVMCPIILK